MIITVTLNPLLEKMLFFEKIETNKVNRAYKAIYNSGGKGINVSRQLNHFNIENLATGFLGGENGKRLKSLLYKEQIKNSFQQINSETREGIAIVEKNVIKESYFDPDPLINSEEVENLIVKTKKAILNSEMIIFSGSSPRFQNDEDEYKIFSSLISFALDNDKFVLLDIYGKRVDQIFNLKPTIVHLNLEELEQTIGKEINNLNEKIRFGEELYTKKGIKIFLLTDGSKEFIAMNQGIFYKIIPPKINSVNSTGSGDAFMAGFIYGLHNNLSFEQILKYATAAGAANAEMFDVCSSPLSRIEELTQEVSVIKLN